MCISSFFTNAKFVNEIDTEPSGLQRVLAEDFFREHFENREVFILDPDAKDTWYQGDLLAAELYGGMYPQLGGIESFANADPGAILLIAANQLEGLESIVDEPIHVETSSSEEWYIVTKE